MLADADLEPFTLCAEATGRAFFVIVTKMELADEALRNCWIPLAERFAHYWEALHFIAARFLRDRLPLPDALADWLANVLEGKQAKPKRRPGRQEITNSIRNVWIRGVICKLESLGMTPTRNVDSRPKSACDAVAFVMGLSYQAVVSIFRPKKTG